MVQRVALKCRSGYAQLRNIWCIRRYLSDDATKWMVRVRVLVTLIMDYCNALIHGLLETMTNKQEHVHNTAYHIVTSTARNNQISHVLKKLHWLPVKYRAQYKLPVHTYKALHDTSPVYATGSLRHTALIDYHWTVVSWSGRKSTYFIITLPILCCVMIY